MESPFNIDIEYGAHKPDRQILKIESIGSLPITVEDDIRKADVLKYERSSIGFCWKQVFHPSS